MNTNKLAPGYVSELQEMYESGLSDTFLSHITQLRSSGWPLSAIATALGVSKTTVAKWANKKFDAQEITAPAYYLAPLLSQEEISTLQDLTQKSSKIRRFTPENSPARQDARELEKLLIQYKNLGVTVTDLAEACGVSRRAINQRLDKYRED